MNRLIATNSVPQAQADAAPASGTPQFATDGNPAAAPPVPGTIFPAYQYNSIQEEIIAVQSLFGAAPNSASLTQMAAALTQAMSSLCYGPVAFGATDVAVPSWANWCDFIATGAGGGSGASDANDSGGGGGGGSTMFGSYPVTGLQQLPCAIGAGGSGLSAAPASAAAQAASGGATTIGSGADECSAPPGQGGFTGTSGDPNYGGGFGGGPATGPHVTWTVGGGDGTDGEGGGLYAGDGGASYWGGGGRGAKGGGRPGQAPGSGAGGAYNGAFTGASGANGLLLVRFRP